ncbi:MAG: hypothetical protein N5P05_004544 (plasmid) [Chroococcopsis gigantea SAG 12.99]|jgi:putative PIN family toxin of toxin-antitoxin system|nr:hypothetical protein [Chroococcopsis gigantea SAG 12.99]
MNERRFVLDTNIIISAVLRPGNKPDLALKKAQEDGTILMSPSTWLELENVLARPKFERYITLDERQEFLGNFSETVELIVDVTEVIEECRDPKDNKYLELAVSGGAECILTGDEDLLVLHPFRGIDILTVQEFLSKI